MAAVPILEEMAGGPAGAMISELAGLAEGPMERAGKEIDKSVQSAGKQLEKVGQKIQDSAQGNKWPGT